MPLEEQLLHPNTGLIQNRRRMLSELRVECLGPERLQLGCTVIPAIRHNTKRQKLLPMRCGGLTNSIHAHPVYSFSSLCIFLYMLIRFSTRISSIKILQV